MAINKPQRPLPEYLLEFSRETLRESDLPERARCETSVTLRRRFRANSKSDSLGRFSLEMPGQWLGDAPEHQMRLWNMHVYPIVKPVIKANQSSMVQARVEPTVEATSKNPNLVGVASIGKGIAKFVDNHPDLWSNNLESQIAQQVQTDYGCFLHTYHDPDAESHFSLQVDEYSDEPLEEPGEYACAHCGAGGPLFSEQMGRAEGDVMPCLQCGEQAEIITQPDKDATVPIFKGKTEHPAGNTVMDIVSAFQIRIDERNTKNGNLRKARWLEHHYRVDEEDLQAMVPYFGLGTPSEWSYPIRWEYALETGTDLYLKGTSELLTGKRPQHEIRRIYMRPAQYRHYRAPADFSLDRGDGRAALNREGQPMLQIKRGQKLVDIFPRGFWFVVCSDRLLPWIEPCDLRDEWAYLGFLNDSSSFWAQPMTELNELQRTANNLWTIDVQHRESGSIVTTVYDRNWFSADDFERQLSPTREGIHIEPNDDIGRHFRTVPPPAMNGAMEGMGFIRGVLGDISGVQPAAIGAPSNNEPYAAQRLQKESSLGLLTPSQQSKADAKTHVISQFLKWAQRTMPIEWFQYIGTMYGEEWKEQDIEAFLNSNLELDLRVGYKAGSEVPNSLIEQELKLRQFILDLGAVAANIQDPSMLSMLLKNLPEMLSQYAEVAGIDYDLANIAADQRLADSRYQKIRAWLEANRDVQFDPSLSAEEAENALVDIALADRAFQVMTFEDHETHKEFYADHARALMAADEPNFPLISCCIAMVARHEAGGVADRQTASASEVEGQAPQIAAQMGAGQVAAQAEADQHAQKLQAQTAIAAAQLQTQKEMKAMELQAKAVEGDKDREHAAALKAAELQVKMAEVGKGEPGTTIEPPEDPHETVLASVDYEDAPPAAQAAILRELGLPSTGVKEVHASTLQKAQFAAAAKARASRPSSNGGSR